MLKKTTIEEIDITSSSSPASQTGKTIIGKQVSIEGEIQGKEDLVIEGVVKGGIDLEKFHLTVGPKGKVEAVIQAGNVTVSGQLKGNIQAQDKVEITREANFNGEIKAKRISVEDGAYLKAVIEVERESRQKVPTVGKTADLQTSEAGKGSITLAGETEKGK